MLIHCPHGNSFLTVPLEKKRRVEDKKDVERSRAPVRQDATKTKSHPTVVNTQPKKPIPASNLLNKLSTLRSSTSKSEPTTIVSRSSGFSSTPPPAHETEETFGAPRRDDRLALIEDLEPGPYEHKPPFDDPHFETVEPNSGIRLRYVSFLCAKASSHIRQLENPPP